jgi:hypothetical protein
VEGKSFKFGMVILLLLTTIASIPIPVEALDNRFDEIEVYAKIVEIEGRSPEPNSMRVKVRMQLFRVEHIGYAVKWNVEIGDIVETEISNHYLWELDEEEGKLDKGDLVRANLRKGIREYYEDKAWLLVSYVRLFNTYPIVVGYVVLNAIICIILIGVIEYRKRRSI